MDYQIGNFLDGKYPYVKFGSGKKKLVIFPPSRDLMGSLALNPEAEIKTYRQMLPKDFDREVLQDQFFSISRFEETAELIPNSKLVFIEGAGHPTPLEQSKLVKKEVFRFLGFS